jgi:hypothetical protein
VVLLFAPGNEARLVHDIVWTGSRNLFTNGSIDIGLLIERLRGITVVGLRFYERGIFVLIIVSLLAGAYIILNLKEKIKLFTFFFLAAGFTSMYSLIVVPWSGARPYLSVTVFFLITALSLLAQIKKCISTLLVKKVFWVSVCIAFGVSFIGALKDIVNVYTKFKDRVVWVSSQREKGIIENIEVNDIVRHNRHCAVLCDVGYADWVRIPFAMYYGVKSIVVNNREETKNLDRCS